MYADFCKRGFDFVVAGFLTLLMSPFFAAVAIAIRIESRGPILFRQQRLGKDGTTFEMLKFRTMTDEPRAVDREIHAGDPDVTRVGRWLRRLKIDETPQLFNILRGDMSFVGPRPCMPEQRATFNETAEARLLVRPGLTGLAQVNGNIHLSWQERWIYDAQYARNVSALSDLLIVLKTLLIVLAGERRFLRRPGHNQN